jgi:ribose 5-phosphate isomerase B
MLIALGADHAGFDLKEQIRGWLSQRGIEVLDLGPHTFNPEDDYPDFARAVALSVAGGESDLGIIVCSTGIGSCIAANKLKGVRAALCQDTFCAHMTRLHNDANVLCLGSNVVGPLLAQEIANTFVSTSFSGEERHRRRVAKIAEIEAEGARR